MIRGLHPVSDDTVRRARNMFERSAMAAWLGAHVRAEDGEHIYTLAFDEAHIGNPVIRALHGGVISAFLQSAATWEVLARSEVDIRARPISVHTSYHRGSRDQDLAVAVDVQRVGRRIAFVEARGWQGERDKTIASAQIALRLFQADEG